MDSSMRLDTSFWMGCYCLCLNQATKQKRVVLSYGGCVRQLHVEYCSRRRRIIPASSVTSF
ncbi:hypothetical protein [Hyella patelloides]|uniref:hypothetical protein n=1 Tax=Hyella patelloides TaxID=1982969 RepID=UPI0011A47952|nr:hypothetical protein [Hyella patelloides]